MFDTKERAALAANIAGSLAAGQGWDTSNKELVRIAEDILDEIELVYEPRVTKEEKQFNEYFRELASLNPLVI